jgi:hypothetical protein
LNSLVEILVTIKTYTLEEQHLSKALLPRIPSACLSHCPNSANALDLLCREKIWVCQSQSHVERARNKQRLLHLPLLQTDV